MILIAEPVVLQCAVRKQKHLYSPAALVCISLCRMFLFRDEDLLGILAE
jgi:hypothetical protein